MTDKDPRLLVTIYPSTLARPGEIQVICAVLDVKEVLGCFQGHERKLVHAAVSLPILAGLEKSVRKDRK